jgi:hypothetical protein
MLPNSLAPLLLVGLLAGCASPPARPPAFEVPRTTLFPASALITQRAVLKVRGREFALNGYLALNDSRDMRLVVTALFGQVLADVLVKQDGRIRVMQSSGMLRPAWIERYVAADVQCIFGGSPPADCPARMLSSSHFVVTRRWYTLDVRIVQNQPGPQRPELFDENRPGKL